MDGSIVGLGWQSEAAPLVKNNKASDGITARLVVNENGYHEAQRLRYDAYLAAGYLQPREVKLFADSHDSRASSRSLVIYLGGQPAASVRVCLLDHSNSDEECGQLPASAMFKTEIETFLKQRANQGYGTNAVEITRLARSPVHAKNLALVLGLYHVAGYLILHFQADVIFAAVTKNHTTFYKRMGFREIAQPKDYPGLDVQTVLMGCLLEEHRGIPGRTLALKEMSLSDDTYLGLIAGERVPVFDGDATSAPDLVVNRKRTESDHRLSS
ncbi:MAG: hypothetical protein B7Z58_00820 [Acidiphilium sp. 37-64-53]|nr:MULTISPECIES: hypothetical protein [Acidiphilium]OYW04144.1 MAG: hypothetical protein B7Z58_00820 [Acidiphilium sp. 37-64-53]OZB31079.1 MAG: hypothetical protein B7X49_00360 [Acidiphilium sp. 34-64-41]HQT83388.1 hypothetical protein [Acidiphilium rubrum]